MTVFCTDKTGTLTENRLSLHGVTMAETISPVFKVATSKEDIDDRSDVDAILVAAVLASNEHDLDPIDTAIVNRFAEHSRGRRALHSEFRVDSFEPFTKETHRTLAHVTRLADDAKFGVSKGAVDSLLQLCECSADEQSCIRKLTFFFVVVLFVNVKRFFPVINTYADQLVSDTGCRVLAVAVEHGVGGRFRFRALLALADTLRAESPQVVTNLQRLCLFAFVCLFVCFAQLIARPILFLSLLFFRRCRRARDYDHR